MKRFGEELKATRESKNISLQDISKATRINVKFIEAIEAGNLSILPQTYIRAFIKSYAKNVGLDQKETVTRYEIYNSGKTPDTKAKTLKTVTTEETDESQKAVQPSQTEQPTKVAEPVPKKTVESITPSETSKPEPAKDIPEKKQIKDTPKQDIPEKKQNENTESKNAQNDSKENNSILDQADYTVNTGHVKYLETPKVNYFAIFSVIALVLIILIFVVFKIPFQESVEPTRKSIDTIVKEMEEQQKTEQTENVVSNTFSEPTVTYPISDSLVLGLLSETDVWVSIRMDQDRSDRGTIIANTMKRVTAKERFTITAIRGRQIKIYLNNQLLGNLSQSDSLRTSIVTLNGIVYLKPSTPTPPPRSDDTDLKPLEPVFR